MKHHSFTFSYTIHAEKKYIHITIDTMGDNDTPDKLPGEDSSLWVATTRQTNYPTLEHDQTIYDVVIVGGGITGIAAAFLLQHNRYKVALIEKNRIVEWTTGSTTAKLTSQHYLIYDYLIKRHGRETAKAFANANQEGINEVEKLSKDLGIDCDFSHRDAYVYSQQSNKVDDIKTETEAAKSLGLPASFEDEIDLPFTISGAIKFSNQAQFHPRKFLLGLVEHFISEGGILYEQTEATDIKTGHPHSVVTNNGDLKGKNIIQASGEPFWRNEILEGRMWVKMSYALAVKLKEGSDYPNNMYITTDPPIRTIRSAPYNDGEVMIFGGESHEYDDDTYDPDARYQKLAEDVNKYFAVEKILYRWLAGDFMPYDRIPYIGPDPDHPSIYVSTGYRAWGLAWSMSAARGILSYIEGKPVDWIQPFSLERLKTPLRPEDKNHEV